jgi:hypothetical protein
MINQTISVAEAKKNLSEILGKVAFGKKQILITKRGLFGLLRFLALIPASQIISDDVRFFN